MPTTPTIQYRPEQPYVSIPISVTLREWGKANALVPEIIGWLTARGLPMIGAPFYRYRAIGDLDRPFELEVGVPVSTTVPGDGPADGPGDGHVIAGSIPAGTYAVFVHHGHPDRLRDSLSMLEDWVRAQGLACDKAVVDDREVWAGRFEHYLTDPAVEPDLDRWSIEIAYLLCQERLSARPPGRARA